MKVTEGAAMKHMKRIAVAILGGTGLAIGLALIVLPGPAFIVIPIGLAFLAMECARAQRWLRSLRALLPKKSRNGPSRPKKPMTLQSVRQRVAFLFRQLRRTV